MPSRWLIEGLSRDIHLIEIIDVSKLTQLWRETFACLNSLRSDGYGAGWLLGVLGVSEGSDRSRDRQL